MASESLEFDLSVEGLSSLEAKLKEIDGRIARKIVADGIRKGAILIKKEAKMLAPRRSGTLRKAIKHRVRRQSSRSTHTVGRIFVEHGLGAKYDAFYARFVELGTDPYQIPEPEHYAQGTKVLSDKSQIFGRKVEHPGMPGQFFMTRAIENKRLPAIQLMAADIRLALRRLGRNNV